MRQIAAQHKLRLCGVVHNSVFVSQLLQRLHFGLAVQQLLHKGIRFASLTVGFDLFVCLTSELLFLFFGIELNEFSWNHDGFWWFTFIETLSFRNIEFGRNFLYRQTCFV